MATIVRHGAVWRHAVAAVVVFLVLVGLLVLPPVGSAEAAGPIPIPPREGPGASVFDGDPATTERVLRRDPTSAAVAASQMRFAPHAARGRHATHVVLTRDDEFADALAGSALTGDGPLLFTRSDRLTPATRAEIERVLPEGGRVHVLGGTKAIRPGVAEALRDAGYKVTRLAGASRVETAIAVAGVVRARSGRREVIVARAYGTDTNPTAAWADSVSGGAVAAAAGVPVLVTPTDRLHPAVASWLRRNAPERSVLVGGPGALSPAVERALPRPARVAGGDRAGTAAAIARRIWNAPESGRRAALVVHGWRPDGWAYGFVAAGLAADARRPVLLVADHLPDQTRRLVSTCGEPEVDVLVVGDGAIVGPRTRELLDAHDGEACASGGTLPRLSRLENLSGCDDTLAYFRDNGLERVGPYGLDGGGFIGIPEDRPAAGEDADGGAQPAPAPAGDTSGTNVQEEGVDEPDILESDGRVAVAVAKGRLQVVDLTGGASRLASTVDLPAGFDHQLLLHGDKLLVLSRTGGFVGPVPEPGPGPEPAPADDPVSGGASTERQSTVVAGPLGTVLTLVDVSDADAPEVEATLELDGDHRSARMIGSVARIVVSSYPHELDFTYPEDGTAEAERDALEHNRRTVADAPLRAWLPDYTLTDRGTGETTEGPLLGCADIAAPPWFAGFSTLTVVTLDVAAGLTPTDAEAVVANGDTLYASPGSLYLTTSRWSVFEPGVAGEAVSTEVHAFDISDPAAARYVASGTVPGYVLNQFSLSEHDGHLRIATTTEPPWEDREEGATTESQVLVLRPNDGDLEEVGRLGGLGRDERIFAVRFLGDLGAVVTFRQIDPLFLVDLRDPTDPRLLGELKVPGFSSYLHRVSPPGAGDQGSTQGPDLLMGVGQDADEDGRTRGAQVSLFDISDRTAPRRIDALTYENATSEVEYDHHAFLHWAPTGRAVIPLQQYDPEQGRAAFLGALAIDVAGDGLTEAGRVTHGDADGEEAWSTAIRRSFVVGDTLYTMSESGLLASDLASLAERDWVPFDD